MPTNRKDEVMTGLLAGIAELTSSDRWQDWLTVQSRFHRNSFNNALLIALQQPDATRVAGFNAWRRLGRNVRKGEKAIWILAPVTRKVETERTNDAGEPETVAHRSPVAFKPAAVFDISQTDGDELPTVDLPRSPGATRNQPAQPGKTLVHELAHATLHEGFDDRSLAELEAESVAYIVCDALGIDSSDYSFGYVATWSGGGDEAIARIKSAGSRIQRTAAAIIAGVETTSSTSENAA